MLDRAKHLSSSPGFFSKECYDLRKMFLKLKYPAKLIDSIFKRFTSPRIRIKVVLSQLTAPYFNTVIKITLPLEDQKSADSACAGN